MVKKKVCKQNVEMYHYKSEEWENLGDLEFGNRFLDAISKAHSMRGKAQLGFTEIQNIYAVKETCKRIERQATKRNKLFKKHIPDKSLVCKIQRKI